MSNIQAAAQSWDTMNVDMVRAVAWSSLSFIPTSIHRRFSGSENAAEFVQRHAVAGLQAAVDQLPPKLRSRARKSPLKGLAMVCGDMEAERAFFETRTHLKCKEVDGYDISRESLRRYKPKRGLTFHAHVADCNYLNLPQDTYALAVACHGAHHVYNLGNFFYQINKALKDGGVMYMIEWIGPNRLQIPFWNHVISTVLLWAFFSKRERTTHMGHIKGRWVQYEPDTWEPSEACNSVELMPQFLKYFEPISEVGHGGLCYPIFEGIAQNLDQTNPLTALKIKTVYWLETVLTKVGIVQPLFVMVVGRKRPGVF